MRKTGYSRRNFLRYSAATLGVSCTQFLNPFASPLSGPLATALAAEQTRKRHCILLWMAGGPSQLDTFDLKPDHENGGEFQEIATAVPGLRISEHLPGLAAMTKHMAVVRSLSTKEGDHGRGTYLMRTGHAPGTPVKYPTIGSSISKELGELSSPLPNYVAINQNTPFGPEAFSPGFLGPQFASATVNATPPANNNPGNNPDSGEGQREETGATPAFAQMRVENLKAPGVSEARVRRRLQLWEQMQEDFLATRPVAPAIAHHTIYQQAVRTMNSAEVEAFDLSAEPTEIREAYGRGTFGQGCLVARRLVERGVPFVEVSLGADGIGWDTHANNFETVKSLSQQLDHGWSTLMRELDQIGLLQDTTILWMGEFGRTPKINDQGGRDHFPNAWSCAFAGGGILGGQAYGATTDDGMEVKDNKVEVGDVLATLCSAVGIDPETENVSPLGRPHKIAEGTPIREILG